MFTRPFIPFWELPLGSSSDTTSCPSCTAQQPLPVSTPCLSSSRHPHQELPLGSSSDTTSCPSCTAQQPLPVSTPCLSSSRHPHQTRRPVHRVLLNNLYPCLLRVSPHHVILIRHDVLSIVYSSTTSTRVYSVSLLITSSSSDTTSCPSCTPQQPLPVSTPCLSSSRHPHQTRRPFHRVLLNNLYPCLLRVSPHHVILIRHDVLSIVYSSTTSTRVYSVSLSPHYVILIRHDVMSIVYSSTTSTRVYTVSLLITPSSSDTTSCPSCTPQQPLPVSTPCLSSSRLLLLSFADPFCACHTPRHYCIVFLSMFDTARPPRSNLYKFTKHIYFGIHPLCIISIKDIPAINLSILMIDVYIRNADHLCLYIKPNLDVVK